MWSLYSRKPLCSSAQGFLLLLDLEIQMLDWFKYKYNLEPRKHISPCLRAKSSLRESAEVDSPSPCTISLRYHQETSSFAAAASSSSKRNVPFSSNPQAWHLAGRICTWTHSPAQARPAQSHRTSPTSGPGVGKSEQPLEATGQGWPSFLSPPCLYQPTECPLEKWTLERNLKGSIFNTRHSPQQGPSLASGWETCSRCPGWSRCRGHEGAGDVICPLELTGRQAVWW